MRLHNTELKQLDHEDRFRRLVELNVMEQCLNVFKTHVVQRRRVETFRERKKDGSGAKYTYPRVHGLVYDPKNGLIKNLPVREFLLPHVEELENIYQVYRPGKTTMDMP